MKKFIAFIAAGLLSITAWASGPVNINTATAEEIADSLKGVGQTKAERIVEYRNENGAFTHIDELVNVKGIGISTVDRNRDMILLSDSEPESKD